MNAPVEQTEEDVKDTKQQELLVHEAVDAALPPEQEPGEASKPHVGHFQTVGDRHVEAEKS